MILVATAAGTTRISNTGPLTTIHLILIVLFAVLVVAGILWGAKQKRARAEGEQEERGRADALTAHPPTAAAPPPPVEPVTSAAPQPLMSAPVAQPKPATKPKAVTKPKAALPVAKTAPKAKAAAEPAKPGIKTPASKARISTVAPVATKPGAAKATAAKPAAKPVQTKAVVAKPAPKPAVETETVKPAVAAAKPAAAPAAKASAAAGGYGLIDVKGLGPKAVPLLDGLGVRTLADLAGLNAARTTEIDGQLGALSGRMARDRWVEQAKLLAAGKVAEFEATYGKL